MLQFAKDVKRVFGLAPFSKELAVDWINIFIDLLTKEDKDKMKELCFAWDSGHTVYRRIFE